MTNYLFFQAFSCQLLPAIIAHKTCTASVRNITQKTSLLYQNVLSSLFKRFSAFQHKILFYPSHSRVGRPSRPKNDIFY